MSKLVKRYRKTTTAKSLKIPTPIFEIDEDEVVESLVAGKL